MDNEHKSFIVWRSQVVFGGAIQISSGYDTKNNKGVILFSELKEPLNVGDTLPENAEAYDPQVQLVFDNIWSLNILRDAIDNVEQAFKYFKFREPIDKFPDHNHEATQEESNEMVTLRDQIETFKRENVELRREVRRLQTTVSNKGKEVDGLREKFKKFTYGIEGKKKVKRRIIPIDEYRGFDKDGWSNKILVGMRIRDDGTIDHFAYGDLRDFYGEREFVDVDGNQMLNPTHVAILKQEDFKIADGLIVFKPED